MVNGLVIVLGVALFCVVVFMGIYFFIKGKGSIKINLERMEYSPGETIKGQVILTLKKPVEARALNVGLIGERKTSSYSSGHKNTRKDIIFNFSKALDKSGKFVLGEKSYDFELKVPADVLKKGNVVLDSVVRSAQALLGGGSSTSWYVASNLDVKGFDISKKVRINLG